MEWTDASAVQLDDERQSRRRAARTGPRRRMEEERPIEAFVN
jgi:hypothetical protein